LEELRDEDIVEQMCQQVAQALVDCLEKVLEEKASRLSLRQPEDLAQARNILISMHEHLSFVHHQLGYDTASTVELGPLTTKELNKYAEEIEEKLQQVLDEVATKIAAEEAVEGVDTW
jgi:lauroyl/myristoyl acyltransferase